MNRNYKVIWNQSLNCFMAVAEYAKSRGKSSNNAVSASTPISADVAIGGAHLLRLSALCMGLIAAGLSVPAMAAYEDGGGSTSTNCTPSTVGGTTKSSGIAIGASVAGQVACAPTGNSIAIGGEATTAGGVNNANLQSIAIGNKTVASGDQSVALGANVIASGNSSVAVGGDDIDKIASNTTQATQYSTITGGTLVSGSYPTTTASGAGASAFGVQSVASGSFSTALGMTSSASGAASVALGVSSKASGQGALAIGAVSNASADGSVALGINSKSSGLNSIAIGSGSTSATGANASGENATSIGSQSSAAANATAIGAGAKANQAGGVAIGTDSVASIAAGIKGFDPSTGGPTSQTSNVWNSTRAAVALGDSATGITRQLTGLAAGTNDSDAVNVAQLKTVTNQTFKIQANGDTASSVKSSDTVQFIDGKNIKIARTGNNITVATADNLAADSITAGNSLLNTSGLTISGGPSVTFTGINAGNKKITGVAAGESATDAANVGQLTNLQTVGNNKINQLGGNAATNLGGGATYNAATGAISQPSYKLNKNTVTANNVGEALTNLDGRTSTNTDNIATNTANITKAKTTVTAGDNVVVTPGTNTDGSANYVVKTKDDLALTSVTTGNSILNTSGLTIRAADPANNVVLSSTGLNNGNNKITNVAAGTLSDTSKDAVNGAQLNATNKNVAINTTNITKNAGDITDLTIGKTGIVRQDAGTGAITVGAGTGGTSVNFANQAGVNRQLTGVASAGNITETANANNAVNAGDLNNAIGSVEGTIIDKGFALQAADGKKVQKKLGEAVDVVGANSNITTAVTNGKVEIALNDALDLGVDGSLKTGNTVTNNAGVRVDDGLGNITAVTTAGTKVVDTAGNSADYTATGSSLADKEGNTNLSTATGNIITNGVNVTSLTAAGTNVTDGTSTSSYGANGFAATDGTNTTTFNQTGLSFNDGSNNIGPSITAGGINAGNTVITNVGEAVNAGDAVNKGQLDTITGNIAAGGIQYDRNPDNSVNYNQVTLAGTPAVIGKDANDNNIVISGGTSLKNVANGVIASDAVNKGQLDGATKVKVFDKNGNEITVNIADQIVNTNVNNSNTDSLFLTYDVKGQEVTDRLTIGETVQKMNTEGVKFAHTNGVAAPVAGASTNDSSAGAVNSTAIGVNAIVAAGADSTVALGHDTNASATATNSVVIGKGSQVNGASSVAIGHGSKANGYQSIAIGTDNTVNGDNSGAFGDPNIVNGNNSYSVGNNNTINSNDTFVFGNGVTQTTEGSVVLGTGSGATTGAGIIGYLGINDINNAIFITRSTTGAVAVGDAGAGIYRQITGVAAGTADSDAVNVAQLKAVNATLSDAAIQYDKDQNGDVNKDNITLGGGTAGTTITNVNSGDISATSTQAINGSQLHNLGSGIASIIGGNATYDANGNLTASNIGGTGQSNINDAIASINSGNALATENIKANSDRLDAGLSFGADSGADINKSIGDGTAFKFEGGNNITTTATGNGIKFDLNGNISVDSVTTGNTTVNNNGVTIKDGPSMTIDGIYAGNKTITGVADGIKVNDAVNLGQLNALDQKISNSVNELGYKIGEVEDDANAGISAAMAMSSLPQAYIPGKSMISGGIATYNGQSAVAVGVSKVSDNGRWVIKANGTADTQGNAGGAIGAGFHF